MQAKLQLTRLERIVSHLENGVLVLLLTAMIVLAITQILLRNVLGMGLAWGEPLSRVLVLWVGLAGAVVATRTNHHISVNVLLRFLPQTAQAVTRCLVDCFAALVCAVVAYHAARFVYMEYELDSVAFATIPTWLCALIIPVAFTIIALHYLAFALDRGRQLVQGKSKP